MISIGKRRKAMTIECTSITIHRYTTSIYRTVFFFFIYRLANRSADADAVTTAAVIDRKNGTRLFYLV